jgi:hypothetical protein
VSVFVLCLFYARHLATETNLKNNQENADDTAEEAVNNAEQQPSEDKTEQPADPSETIE